MSGEKILWIDLETGGLDPASHQITQIAATATYATPRLKPVDGAEFEAKVRLVDGRYTEEALEAQMYDPETWEREAVPIAEAIGGLLEFAEGYTTPRTSKRGNRYFAVGMGGHNVQFDADFLRATAKRGGVFLPITAWTGGLVDTLHLAKWVSVIRREEFPSYTLTGLRSAVGLPEIDAHDALEDVRATIELARVLLVEVGRCQP